MSLRTLAEARSRSALLRRLETTGRLAMLAAVYDLTSGDLSWLKEDAAAVAGAREGDATPSAVAHGGEAGGSHGARSVGSSHSAPASRSAVAEPHSTVANHSHHEPDAHGHAGAGAGAGVSAGAAAAEHDEHLGSGGAGHGTRGEPSKNGAHDPLPIVHWPAPLGEGKPAHDGTHGDHGDALVAAPAHSGSHGAAAHGNGEHVVDVESHSHDSGGHVAAPSHGDEHGAHGAQPAIDDHHAAATSHGEHGVDAAHGSASVSHDNDGHGKPADTAGGHHAAAKSEVRWQDPIVLVGISGVLSLLLAAVLALKR